MNKKYLKITLIIILTFSLIGSGIFFYLKNQNEEIIEENFSENIVENEETQEEMKEEISQITEEKKENKKITITSPVYTLTGTVLNGTTKINVKWENGDTKDEYELKQFKAGNKEFLTNLRLDYGNIGKGENIYILEFYKENELIGNDEYLIVAEYEEVKIGDKIFYINNPNYYYSKKEGIFNGVKYSFYAIRSNEKIYFANKGKIELLKYEGLLILDKLYYFKEIEKKDNSRYDEKRNIYDENGTIIFEEIDNMFGLDGILRIIGVDGKYVFIDEYTYGPGNPNYEIYFEGNNYKIIKLKNRALLYDNLKNKVYFYELIQKDIFNNLTFLFDYNGGFHMYEIFIDKFIILNNGKVIDMETGKQVIINEFDNTYETITSYLLLLDEIKKGFYFLNGDDKNLYILKKCDFINDLEFVCLKDSYLFYKDLNNFKLEKKDEKVKLILIDDRGLYAIDKVIKY